MFANRMNKVLVVLAMGLGGVATSVAAPASKPISTTSDLNVALKTARPINIALLEQDEVLADMKCSDEQRKAIAEIFKTAREEQEAAMRQALPQPQIAGGGAVRIVGRAFPGTIKYDTEKLAAALKADQLIRLRQLELHLRGPQAFADRRVIRTLGLSAEQELKAEEIIIRFEPEFSATMPLLLRGGKDADMKPLADLNEKFVGECLKLLTKEQKQNWDWLVGKRPETVQWVRAIAPVSAFNNVAAGVMIQGGAIRIAPAIPVAPVPVAPPVVDLPVAPPKK